MNLQEQGPSIEDCIKLLKGERDEQRLAGLLLATKFCKNDDFDSILMVYNALGNTFLDRLLRTGSYCIYLLLHVNIISPRSLNFSKTDNVFFMLLENLLLDKCKGSKTSKFDYKFII